MTALYPHFSHAMAQLLPGKEDMHLVVAVSGGADSMAACLLAQQWVKEKGGRLTALTVDHGLRPESAQEAKQVAKWVAAHAIPHHILTWQGEKPTRNIQDKAREARYQLMAQWCRAHDCQTLLTGHHQDDQLETFWMRLTRGSGPFGLAGMSAMAEPHGVQLVRPLLEVPKIDVVAWLKAQGQAWIEDPSNDSAKYTRNRLRSMLVEEGLGRHRQLQTLRAMQHSRMAEEARLLQALNDAVQLYDEGYATISRNALKALSQETILRVLSRVLTTVSGAEKPPRMAETETLYQTLEDTARTLHGCMIVPQQETLLVIREPARMQQELLAEAAGGYGWDGRFRIQLSTARPGRCITALYTMPEAMQALRDDSETAALLTQLPKAVLPTLPMLMDKAQAGLEAVLAIPHIDYYRDEQGKDAVTSAFTPHIKLGFAPFRVLRV